MLKIRINVGNNEMQKGSSIKEKPLERLVGGYSNTAIFRKVAFVGDSLSSGEFEIINSEGNKEYHDLFEYSWGQFIARRNGIKAYNFSRGGMSAKWYMESFADEKGFWDKEKACQAYIIALGVNDLYHIKIKLGSVHDIDKYDYKNNADTFAGYYAQIISRYKEISPEAKFFLVGLPKSSARENMGEIEEKMTALLYDLADHFDNTYVIDLYHNGEDYDQEFKEKYFLNGHMNPMGYMYTAEIIDSYIDYIIRQNPEEFKYVGLINSGIDYVK